MDLTVRNANVAQALLDRGHHARRATEVDVALTNIGIGGPETAWGERVVIKGELITTPRYQVNTSAANLRDAIQLSFEND